MKKAEVLRQLESMGTAQNRKVYSRHGVKNEMSGVSYANLGKLKKAIKVDHELARQLWATGNHDARVLATMIADPAETTARDADGWVKDLSDHVLTAALSGLVARSSVARKRMQKWIAARSEWKGAAGWSILCQLADSSSDFTDEELGEYLETIEQRIHQSPSRVRYAMNSALIAIGVRNARLQKKATAAAKRIGKVEVDHGETGCKTPDAVAYIKKTVEHRRTKRAGHC